MDSVEQFVNLLKGMSDRIEKLEKEVSKLNQHNATFSTASDLTKQFIDGVKTMEYKLKGENKMTIKEKLLKEIEEQIDQLHIYREMPKEYSECVNTIEKLYSILHSL